MIKLKWERNYLSEGMLPKGSKSSERWFARWGLWRCTAQTDGGAYTVAVDGRPITKRDFATKEDAFDAVENWIKTLCNMTLYNHE